MQMSVRYITQATPRYISKLLDKGIAVFSNVHHAAQSYQSYQISVLVINVGLRIGPLSVKSKDPCSLGKDSLFYWKKLRVIVMNKTETGQPMWCD